MSSANGKQMKILPTAFVYSLTATIVGGYGTVIVSGGIDGSNDI